MLQTRMAFKIKYPGPARDFLKKGIATKQSISQWPMEEAVTDVGRKEAINLTEGASKRTLSSSSLGFENRLHNDIGKEEGATG